MARLKKFWKFLSSMKFAILLLLLLIAACALPAAADTPLAIAIDGRPAAEIVVSDGCHSAELFAADETHGQETRTSEKYALDVPELRAALDEETYQSLLDDIALLDEAGEAFDEEKIACGELTPMFFGSAMTNFGVQNFLEEYLRHQNHV